uniref:Uncharacterized protein n=1 Tax=Oryza punctata TaxID=4537 RepID=A0A0E0K348_ORYPU
MADVVVAAAASSSPSTQGGGGGIHVVAKNANSKQFSSALVPVAALLAVAVGAVSLLPSLAQAVWEVPHLFLLGLVVSYGVFAQKISTGGSGGDDGARAWNSRYLSDDPLVVVADNAESDDDDGGRSGRPLSLPVRKLKPPPPPSMPGLESEAGDASDDGIGAETDSSASTAGFWGAGPSPPSVLDTVCRSRKPTATATAAPSAMSKGFPGYGSPAPRDQSFSDDGEVTDWDDEEEEEEEEADMQDEMAASPQRSYDHDDYNGDGNDGHDMAVDEELSELTAEAAAGVEDEVDRKADEFIAKFREQIRLQRL